MTPPVGAEKEWGELTLALAQRVQANPEELGAAADYLRYSGCVTLTHKAAMTAGAETIANLA